MSWYSGCNDASRKLDALLDTQPTFDELLTFPDFTQHLKTFNPKLLDYVSSSQKIPSRIVEFLTVAPSEDTDSNDRKYKFPAMTADVVEIEAACIINSLFKETGNKGQTHLITMFNMLKSATLLPMLAGYFHRTIYALFRSRYGETVESVYAHKQVFDLMIQHCNESTIASSLSMFLNLESTKCSPSSQERVQFKVSIVKKIMQKVEQENQNKQSSSVLAIENLIAILKESVEKYCMVADGKKILDTILTGKFTMLIISMMEEQSEVSIPAMDLCLSLIKYYSFSSFNLEEGSQEQIRRNMERLESQPFVVNIHGRFSDLLKMVKNTPRMTLYHYKLIEVLCHCMTLSSNKIFEKIKESELYPTLIELLFKHDKCNILHKLIERAFLHVFVTEKRIYELYKVYFFCHISIIELTVERLLNTFPSENVLSAARKKGYFGQFMKIIKIYSKIESSNEDIKNAITKKAKIWSKASKQFIKPYEQLVKEELGRLQNVTPSEPLEFKVSQVEKMHPFIENKVALEEVKKEEETMPMTLESSEQKRQEFGMNVSSTVGRDCVKIEEDEFFKQPIEEVKQPIEEVKPVEPQDSNKEEGSEHKDIFKGSDAQPENSASFSDYMNKRMAEAETEIRLQRSMSGEKRLSSGKRTRMASPSPNRKKNSWKEEPQQDSKNSKLPKIDQLKIPVPPSYPNSSSPCSGKGNQNLSSSAVNLGRPEFEEKDKLTMSMANMESLKHTKIVRINVKPEQKKYRRIQEKDKALLIYLGIKC